MRISELAKRADLTPDTIRFYEKIGLLDESHFRREDNNYRDYYESAFARLELVRLGQTVMSLGGGIELFRHESLLSAALPECYRLAAEDGLQRLEQEQAAPPPELRIWRRRSRRRERLAVSSS